MRTRISNSRVLRNMEPMRIYDITSQCARVGAVSSRAVRNPSMTIVSVSARVPYAWRCTQSVDIQALHFSAASPFVPSE